MTFYSRSCTLTSVDINSLIVEVARKESQTLTEAELRLMQIIWKHGPSTVQAVVDQLPQDSPLAYSTVLTMLRILEKKGYLTHSKEGRAFVYHSVVDQRAARSGALKHVMQRFFENSPRLLLANLIEDETLDESDLTLLKQLIENAEDDNSVGE